MAKDTDPESESQPGSSVARITRLRSRRRGRWTAVDLDGESWCELPTEIVLREGLRVGVELDVRRREEIASAHEEWRARQAALHLLSFRPRTRTELMRRLREKEFAAGVAERCVLRLCEAGLVDDRDFAAMYVRDRLRSRPRGRRALLHELRARGVDAATAETVLDEVLDASPETDRERALRAAERWQPRRGEEPVRARRRLHGFLARRGFRPAVIRDVLEERLSDEAR